MRLVNKFGYLQSVSGKHKGSVVSTEDIEEISGKGANAKYWLEKYPGESEEIYEGLPDPRGSPLSTSVYFDSNHANDQVTCQSVSGVLSFVGSTPIIWNSKMQGTIQSSIYPAELCAGKVATEEAITLLYMLSSLGVPVKGATTICGYNLGMITSCTNPESDPKKKYVAISYHKLQESAAAKIVNPLKVCTTVNRADILTKGVSAGTLGSFSDASYGVYWGDK